MDRRARSARALAAVPSWPPALHPTPRPASSQPEARLEPPHPSRVAAASCFLRTADVCTRTPRSERVWFLSREGGDSSATRSLRPCTALACRPRPLRAAAEDHACSPDSCPVPLLKTCRLALTSRRDAEALALLFQVGRSRAGQGLLQPAHLQVACPS